MRKFIRSPEISSFGILLLRIKGESSTEKIIRSLEISSFGILLLRIKEGASPSPCTSTGKIIRNPVISPHRNSHSAYKGRGVSVPVYHDKENYTQPRNFPFQNSPIEYKGMGRLRPYVPRQGKLYAALRFPFLSLLFCV